MRLERKTGSGSETKIKRNGTARRNGTDGTGRSDSRDHLIAAGKDKTLAEDPALGVDQDKMSHTGRKSFRAEVYKGLRGRPRQDADHPATNMREQIERTGNGVRRGTKQTDAKTLALPLGTDRDGFGRGFGQRETASGALAVTAKGVIAPAWLDIEDKAAKAETEGGKGGAEAALIIIDLAGDIDGMAVGPQGTESDTRGDALDGSASFGMESDAEAVWRRRGHKVTAGNAALPEGLKQDGTGRERGRLWEKDRSGATGELQRTGGAFRIAVGKKEGLGGNNGIGTVGRCETDAGFDTAAGGTKGSETGRKGAGRGIGDKEGVMGKVVRRKIAHESGIGAQGVHAFGQPGRQVDMAVETTETVGTKLDTLNQAAHRGKQLHIDIAAGTDGTMSEGIDKVCAEPDALTGKIGATVGVDADLLLRETGQFLPEQARKCIARQRLAVSVHERPAKQQQSGYEGFHLKNIV